MEENMQDFLNNLDKGSMIVEIHDFALEYKESFLESLGGWSTRINDGEWEDIYPTRESREKRFNEIMTFLENIQF